MRLVEQKSLQNPLQPDGRSVRFFASAPRAAICNKYVIKTAIKKSIDISDEQA
jgi:hypothetical protein